MPAARNGENASRSFDAFFFDTRDRATWVARLCSIVYFLFFFLMPWYTARDKVKPVPERVVYHS